MRGSGARERRRLGETMAKFELYQEEEDGGAPPDRQSKLQKQRRRWRRREFSVLDLVFTAFRKSLVITCSVNPREEVSTPASIGWPTDVRHVTHVTFDRFHGFLGLPPDMAKEVCKGAPSASASVFGVSAKSMQCSFDDRGNSVPSILLLMQRELYSMGGLLEEGIFRVNADNEEETYVRARLNKGVVPPGVDLHCLASLIKTWFRELPSGVLDTIDLDQAMLCETEEDCCRLVGKLPPAETALLDWAINLMADVVQHEQYNKMNARNIAMVFAPNLTHMADHLTALIHAVQVMNLLRTLIAKTSRERLDGSNSSSTTASSKEKDSVFEEGRSSPAV